MGSAGDGTSEADLVAGVFSRSDNPTGGRVEVSRPGESHPEPLSEPYLSFSAHTAPAMEPRRTPIRQCAHNFGSRLEIRATQCVARRKCLRSFLYFRLAALLETAGLKLMKYFPNRFFDLLGRNV